jgi:hypothetical protein
MAGRQALIRRRGCGLLHRLVRWSRTGRLAGQSRKGRRAGHGPAGRHRAGRHRAGRHRATPRRRADPTALCLAGRYVGGPAPGRAPRAGHGRGSTRRTGQAGTSAAADPEPAGIPGPAPSRPRRRRSIRTRAWLDRLAWLRPRRGLAARGGWRHNRGRTPTRQPDGARSVRPARRRLTRRCCLGCLRRHGGQWCPTRRSRLARLRSRCHGHCTPARAPAVPVVARVRILVAPTGAPLVCTVAGRVTHAVERSALRP